MASRSRTQAMESDLAFCQETNQMRSGRLRAATWLRMLMILAFSFTFDIPAADADLRAAPPSSIAIEVPVALVIQIVQADFDAVDNGGRRIGNVMLNRPMGLAPSMPAPGFYMLDWDEFEVATEWALLEQKILDEKLVEVLIKFRVVGRTKGVKAKEVRISPSVSPEERVNVYRITRRSNGWKLIDPPMPVVGLKPLVNLYKAKQQEISRTIATLNSKGVAPYANLVRVRELAELRLSDLEVLGRVK